MRTMEKKTLIVSTHGVWRGNITEEINGVQQIQRKNDGTANYTINEHFDEKTNAVKIKIDSVKSENMAVEIIIKDLPI